MKWISPKKNIYEWNRWFAWYPVKIDDSWIWLEFIIRRINPNSYNYNDSIDKALFNMDYEYKESILDVIKGLE